MFDDCPLPQTIFCSFKKNKSFYAICSSSFLSLHVFHIGFKKTFVESTVLFCFVLFCFVPAPIFSSNVNLHQENWVLINTSFFFVLACTKRKDGIKFQICIQVDLLLFCIWNNGQFQSSPTYVFSFLLLVCPF